TDNDVAPGPGQLQFSSATYSVAENAGNASLTITRTGGSDGTVTVQVSITGGTATSGTDYTPPANNTLSFGPGVTSQNLSIPILDDTLVEGNETVNLALQNVTGGATLVAPTTAVLTITDNDGAANPGQLQFSAATFSVAENAGNASITISRTGGSDGTVSVQYAITVPD